LRRTGGGRITAKPIGAGIRAMDVLIEMFVSTVVALAAAVFAHLGLPLGGDAADQGRAVRRSPVAASAPAADAQVTRVSAEDCPELKARRAVVRADAGVIDAAVLQDAVDAALEQAGDDAAGAAAAAEVWAEREAARIEAEAERAHAIAERMADDAAA
jgi:hypothetical protein